MAATARPSRRKRWRGPGAESKERSITLRATGLLSIRCSARYTVAIAPAPIRSRTAAIPFILECAGLLLLIVALAGATGAPWLAAAGGYFVASAFLRNAKYRWMGILTVLALPAVSAQEAALIAGLDLLLVPDVRQLIANQKSSLKKS